MKRFTILAGILLLALSFCLFVSFGSPSVGAEETTTTTLSEEVTEEPAITTEEPQLSQAEIEAILSQIIAQAGIEDIVSNVWNAVPVNVKAVLAIFGIGTPLGLVAGAVSVVNYVKKKRKIHSEDIAAQAQLDKDLLEMKKNFLSLVKNSATSNEAVEGLATVVKSIVSISGTTAKALNILMSSSPNDNVLKQAEAWREEYRKATGDLSAVLVSPGAGAQLLAGAEELKNLIGELETKANG